MFLQSKGGSKYQKNSIWIIEYVGKFGIIEYHGNTTGHG